MGLIQFAMFSFFSHKDSKTSRTIVPTVFLSVVFGFASGVVGMLLVVVYFSPWPDATGPAYVLPHGQTPTASASPEAVPSSVESAVRSVALIYPAGSAAEPAAEAAYLPGEALGAGAVLTSDGWIVSHGDVFGSRRPKSPGDYEAVIGGRGYRLTEAVSDPYTGLLFVKVEAANLPVVAFGDETWLKPGDSVFAFDANRGPRRLDVIGFGPRFAATRGDLLSSSERLPRVLQLSGSDAALTGSMLLNRYGELIGIFVRNGAVESYAVPLRSFAEQISVILRDKTPVRPYLGVTYLDLARVALPGGNRERLNRGALLVAPDAKTPAVRRNSPAAAAGLRAGDVILAVGDEEVTANRSLADLIAEYAVGTEITLTVQRGPVGPDGLPLANRAVSLTVTLKLDRAPAL